MAELLCGKGTNLYWKAEVFETPFEKSRWDTIFTANRLGSRVWGRRFMCVLYRTDYL